MEHEELTGKVIGAAYAVFNELGAGFLESVYEKSLAVELVRLGVAGQRQVPLQVRYRGEVVGEFVADLVVEGLIIVELKAVEKLAKAHEVQLVNYLKATGIDLGLLVNFGAEGVEVRRKVRELPKRNP
ncbi:MAG: GxxExxY protein [Lacipirellulaceae bacterium]